MKRLVINICPSWQTQKRITSAHYLGGRRIRNNAQNLGSSKNRKRHDVTAMLEKSSRKRSRQQRGLGRHTELCQKSAGPTNGPVQKYFLHCNIVSCTATFFLDTHLSRRRWGSGKNVAVQEKNVAVQENAKCCSAAAVEKGFTKKPLHKGG